MLAKLERMLAQDDDLQGLGKALVVRVDLKAVQEEGVTGLGEEIFWAASLNGKSPLKDYIRDVALKRAEKSALESDAVVGTIGLGLDIAFALAAIPAPGAGTALGETWRWIVRKYRLRPNRLAAKLEEDRISSPAFLSFFMTWIRFTENPGKSTYNELTNEVRRLSKGKLFDDFSRLLSLAGYSTMVVLIDEADELPTAPDLYKDLERIFNSGEEENRGLNLAFCLAGSQKKIQELDDEDRFGGFGRRLVGTPQRPWPSAALTPPAVREESGSDDDFAHAVRIYRDLGQTLGSGVLRNASREQEIGFRKSLSTDCEKGALTWHGLWSAVYMLLFAERELQIDEGSTTALEVGERDHALRSRDPHTL